MAITRMCNKCKTYIGVYEGFYFDSKGNMCCSICNETLFKTESKNITVIKEYDPKTHIENTEDINSQAS